MGFGCGRRVVGGGWSGGGDCSGGARRWLGERIVVVLGGGRGGEVVFIHVDVVAVVGLGDVVVAAFFVFLGGVLVMVEMVGSLLRRTRAARGSAGIEGLLVWLEGDESEKGIHLTVKMVSRASTGHVTEGRGERLRGGG